MNTRRELIRCIIFPPITQVLVLSYEFNLGTAMTYLFCFPSNCGCNYHKLRLAVWVSV